ncbi:hypothetical protein IQ264_22115 [Phormidium sp. LEGE 05292]|uniref:hypothetical protein n=1 Tax=[Phormidium] sp. LEGE 05292 TaxID=767427 RepID=UPI0018813B2D|nr:hypothetical protein [Phormidium sp. LEGE 05292]MBE9228121.1 hypothetical protein [Phormidium sp. LEGE 05292]
MTDFCQCDRQAFALAPIAKPVLMEHIAKLVRQHLSHARNSADYSLAGSLTRIED